MSDDKKIKVVLLEPSKLARSVEIDASLEGMPVSYTHLDVYKRQHLYRTSALCQNGNSEP